MRLSSRPLLALSTAIIVAVLALVADAVTATSPAAAYSTQDTRGKAGRVTIYQTLGWNGRRLQSSAFARDTYRLQGPLVNRTKGTRRRRRLARGTQIICMQAVVYTHIPPRVGRDAFWRRYAENAEDCVRARRGQSVDFTNWDFTENYTGGVYSSLYEVSWWSRSGRTRLGARTYDLDDTGDYECQTVGCNVVEVDGTTAALLMDL
jgi:hypothetical protein